MPQSRHQTTCQEEWRDKEHEKRAELRYKSAEVFLTILQGIHNWADVCICQVLTVSDQTRDGSRRARRYWWPPEVLEGERYLCVSQKQLFPQSNDYLCFSAWFTAIHNLSSLPYSWRDRQDAVDHLNTPCDGCFRLSKGLLWKDTLMRCLFCDLSLSVSLIGQLNLGVSFSTLSHFVWGDIRMISITLFFWICIWVFKPQPSTKHSAISKQNNSHLGIRAMSTCSWVSDKTHVLLNV